jgi:hypothetical protein
VEIGLVALDASTGLVLHSQFRCRPPARLAWSGLAWPGLACCRRPLLACTGGRHAAISRRPLLACTGGRHAAISRRPLLACTGGRHAAISLPLATPAHATPDYLATTASSSLLPSFRFLGAVTACFAAGWKVRCCAHHLLSCWSPTQPPLPRWRLCACWEAGRASSGSPGTSTAAAARQRRPQTAWQGRTVRPPHRGALCGVAPSGDGGGRLGCGPGYVARGRGRGRGGAASCSSRWIQRRGVPVAQLRALGTGALGLTEHMRRCWPFLQRRRWRLRPWSCRRSRCAPWRTPPTTFPSLRCRPSCARELRQNPGPRGRRAPRP